MQLVPIGERVIIKPITKEKTKGGIYIPESVREDKKQGIVVAVGKTKDGKDLPISKGDHIIYGGYSSEEIEIDGEKYIILEFKDVIAKIKNSD